MPEINLLGKIIGKRDKDLDAYYKEQYENWTTNKKRDKDPFFLLYKDFDVHLKDISSGALRLFLYYGFHYKNRTGESWPSIDTISKFFNVSTRTINIWNKELEDRGVVARYKTKAKSKTTYLLPFSINLFTRKEEDITNFISNEINKDAFRNVYGELFKVFHMFQWRKKEENDFSLPYHEIFMVFCQQFDLGAYTHYTAFHYKINGKENTVIEDKDFREDILVFESDIEIPGVDIPIEGIAVNSTHNIKSREVIEAILTQLVNKDMDLSVFDKTNLVTIAVE